MRPTTLMRLQAAVVHWSAVILGLYIAYVGLTGRY